MEIEATYVDSIQDKAIEAQRSKIAAIEDQIKEIQIENAERRPIGELIKYGAILILAIGGIFSFLGYSSYQDIKDQIKGEIDVALERNIRNNVAVSQEKLMQFYVSVAESDKRMLDFNNLLKEYQERLGSIEKINAIGEQEDLEGEILLIEREIDHRLLNEPNFESEKPFQGTALDKNWRLGIVSRLREVTKTPLKIANIDPDKWFNLIQSLRAAGMDSLTYEVISSLPVDDGRTSIEAMRLSIGAARASGQEREAMFRALLNMLENVDERSPHIVAGEAWNVAETYRRYTDMISALNTTIDHRKSAGKSPISYLSMLLAESYARRGFYGDVVEAKRHLDIAINAHENDSPRSQWYAATRKKIIDLSMELQ